MMHYDFCIVGSGSIAFEFIEKIHSRFLSVLLVTERTEILNSNISNSGLIAVVNRSEFLNLPRISIGHLILATRDDLHKKNISLGDLLNQIGNFSVHQITLLSSAAVYGECSGPVNENSILSPKNAYGLERVKVEEMVKSLFAATKNLNILRLGNVYGPKFQSGFIYEALNYAKTGGSVPIFSAGSQIRNFLHVADLVGVVLYIPTSNKMKSSQIINIGESRHYSILEVISIIENVLDVRCSTLDLPPPIEAIHSSMIDTKLLGRLYSNKTSSLNQGIRELVRKKAK